ncbi:S8 family serine peptidase [uncultured Kordia sp.]|uniref:S8 family serine peptidase n=1 Tax=uncultured Kordia sp. TaxID=507699 RepID=UPI00260BEBC3|nr:S8 family serine peptidase [uncultured Kordia sp.]
MLTLMAVIFLNCTVASAQNMVYFQDEVITMPNNIASFNWDSMPETAKFDDGYFAWVHFSQTPTQDIQDQFAQRNLKLIEYYPDQTYLAYFPENTQISYLQQSGIVSIIPIENNFKKSTDIKLNNIGDHAMEGNNVIVTLEYYNFIKKSYVLRELSKINAVVVKRIDSHNNYLEVAIPQNQMDAVVSKSFIKWVELISPPPVLADIRGRSLHRSSNLDTQTPTGRNYTGAGIGLLVRDDGVVGPHIDFHGRLENPITTDGGTHADGVSGIMTGAGNLNPTNRGMAVGSDFYTTNSITNTAALTFSDIPTVTLINSGDVQITNNSYGTGCNDGYDGLGRAVDQQVEANLTVLHVFAAGNFGNDNCGYGAGAGWGNIGGGANESKNTIATANTFFNGQLVSSSSRGPAADGRIKPDITAHGQGQVSTNENNNYQSFGGTSGASPGIAGVAAQLYEAYTILNGGALPESALIKAAMLNTATDYGNVGPDFSFGWGMINGLRAAMLIEDGRYLDGTVSQGGSNDHSITVPANTSEVRFMVYWHDAAAAAAASPALVNDLDLVVTDPSNTTHQPWVLDTTPNAAFLNLPATTGIDRLNNVEQVVVSNPAAGTYDINIAGFNVPMGPQKYYIVYEIITDGITLTYPIGGEKLIAGSPTVVHWDSKNAVNNTQIELSEDNGTTWINLATLPPSSRNYTWNVPNNLVSGQCLLRITNGTFTDQSPAVFSAARRVSGVSISQVCPDETTIIWTAVPDATSYDVYILGEKYMEVVGTSTTTSATIVVPNPVDPLWVSVTAKGGNGWESLRSNAVTVNQGNGGLFACPLAKDLTVTAINNTESDFDKLCNTDPIIISADIENDGTDAQSNFTISYQVGSEAIVNETYTGTLAAGASDTYVFSTPATLTTNGDTALRVWTSLADDEFVNNDESVFNFNARSSGSAVNFLEDFETTNAIPEDWTLTNFDNSTTWISASNITGADGNPTQTLFINGFNYNNALGQQDWLVTEYFDLTSVPDATLLFDLSKAQYDATRQDDLRIDISTDCGATFTQIYFKDGADLATVANATSLFEPTDASDWREEAVSLDAYVGNNILLRFAHVNGFGNTTYIDNIRVITSILSVEENTLDRAISMYPNPAKSNVNVVINTSVGNTYEIELMNSLGQTITKIEETRFNARATQNLDVSQYGTGLYFVKVKVGNQSVTKKLIVN